MDWMNFFGRKNIINWLSLYPLFFRNPKKFFKKFYHFDDKEKFLFLLFYLILAMLFHTITRNIDIKEISLYFLFQLALTCQNILLLYLTQLILRKWLNAKRITFKEIFYFFTLTVIIINPILEFLNYLFINSEHYVYAVVNSLIMTALTYFLYIYSNWLFYNQTKTIVIGIFINILLLNIFVIVRNENIISSHNTKPTTAGDLVILNRSYEMTTENTAFFEKFPINDLIPKDKIFIVDSENTIETVFIYAYHKESIVSFLNNFPERANLDLENRQKIKSHIKRLKSVKKAKYRHNQKLISETLKLYSLINSEVNQFEKGDTIPYYIQGSGDPFKYAGFEIYQSKINPKLFMQAKRLSKIQEKFYGLVKINSYIALLGGIIIYPGIEIAEIRDPDDEV